MHSGLGLQMSALLMPVEYVPKRLKSRKTVNTCMSPKNQHSMPTYEYIGIEINRHGNN